MKTKLIFFLSLIGFTSISQNLPTGFQTVAYEGFAYTSGNSLLGLNGGSGFTAAWAQSYLNKYMKAHGTGYTYPNLTTTGGRATYSSTCYGTCNQIASSGRTIPMQSSGVVYVQFLANLGSQAGGGTPQVRFTNTVTNSNAILAGAVTSNSFIWGMHDGANIHMTNLSSNTERFVIIRFDYINNNTKMWIDQNVTTFHYSNPTNPDATSPTANSFNSIDLYFRYNSPHGVDEIHVFRSPPTISSVTANWGDFLTEVEDDIDRTVTVVTSGVEDGQTVTLTLNSVSYTANVSSNSASITITSSGLQALTNNTDYTLTTNVSDIAGNQATAHTSTTFKALNNPSTNNALAFDGVNDYVTANINLPTEDFTYSAWVKFNTVSRKESIFSVGGNNELIIIKNTDGKLAVWIDGSEKIVESSATDTDWHHITLTRSGVNATLYRDGVSIGSSASVTSSALSLGSCDLLIGSDSDSGCNGSLDDYLDGQIDELRIWNDVRTTSEISANMTGELNGNESNLVGYYKFNEPDTNTIASNFASGTGSSYDGLLNNMSGTEWTMSTAMGIILITQIYQSSAKKMIEVTNIGGVQIPGNTYSLNLFSNNSGDMTGILPSVSYTITSNLNANQSIVIENSIGSGFNNINSGAISIIDNNITNFGDANDILILSTSSDSSSWQNRIDVIHSIGDTTSMVLKDEESNPVLVNDSDRWVMFIDDNLDPYRPVNSGGPERHPHDPLISEIDDASQNSNAQLGYHRTGVTNRTAGTWSNGIPDRSRRIVISEDYLHAGSSLSAKQLSINNNSKLAVTNSLLIVSENVTITNSADQIRLIGTSQLVTTHSTSSKVNGNGSLYIDQNSEIASTYRYNYFSSPVTTVGQNTFSLASVLKDGTTPTSSISTPLDINFVTDKNGNTTTPICISTRWLYSYPIAGNGWVHKGSTGIYQATDGFTLKGPGQVQNYTFVGSPKDGEYTNSIMANTYYLAGNPYPSALNAQKFIEDNITSTSGTIYFWEQQTGLTEYENQGHYTSNYVGGYATRNLSMGIAAPYQGGNSVYKAPEKYIAIAQGFFIGGDSDGGQIVFNNSQRECRLEGDDSLFFRNGDNSNTETYQNPTIKIGLNYTNSEGQNLNRQIGISFNEKRSFSFDLGYDSPMFDLQNTDMFWKFIQDDTKYVIAGIQEISDDLEIPLGLTIGSDNEIIIKLDEKQNIERDIYLKDKLTGIEEKLTDNEHGVPITLAQGEYLERYAIVFKESSSLSFNKNALDNNSDIHLYVDNKTNELVLKNHLNHIIKKVTVLNILGQSKKVWTDIGKEIEHRIKIKLPAAFYIVSVTSEEGKTIKKIHLD